MAKARKLPPYSADEIAADPELAAALVRDAEPLLAIERQMKVLREQKADLFDDLRCSRFKPDYAKAWVAAQMPDEEKDAARAEKAIELSRVVAAMDVAKAGQARARAGARPRETKPAPRQETFDEQTGEVLGDAPAPAGEITEVCAAPEGSAPQGTQGGAEEEAVPVAASSTIDHLARVAATTEVLVNGRPPLRNLEPRVPAPAPEWPEMPAGLDRRNWEQGSEAAE